MRRGLRFEVPVEEDEPLLMYAYLETIDQIDPAWLMDGHLHDGWFWWLGPPDDGTYLRLRFSGVEVPDFLARTEGFAELDPGRAAPAEERRLRREQLREFFGSTPVPVIQMDVGPGAEPAFRELTSTRWYVMRLTPAFVTSDEPVVLVADTDIGEDDRLYRLEWIGLPDEDQVRRLRNVFSLAHVADLGDDEDDGGGEREPIGPLPGDGCMFVVPADGRPLGAQSVPDVGEKAFRSYETAPTPRRLVEEN